MAKSMKSIFAGGAMASALVFGLMVAPVQVARADFLPGTVYTDPNNDPFPDSLNGSPSLFKCDNFSVADSVVTCNPGTDGSATGDYSGAFAITATEFNDDGEAIAGTWTFDPDAVTGADPVLYPTKVAVKSGSGWFFYEVVAGILSGEWSTDLLDNKGISHMSFYDSICVEDCDPDTEVPLPAAAWLLLSGLAGLGVVSRRRKTA